MDSALDASPVLALTEARSEGPYADGTLYLMLLELDKLQAPLSALKQLSRCLPDAPASADIRASISAILFRRSRLEMQIRPAPGLVARTRDAVLDYFDDLDDNDDNIAGTT